MDYTVGGILQTRTLELVAFPFSRGFSQPRDQTRVSCIAGGFFTNRAIREALVSRGEEKFHVTGHPLASTVNVHTGFSTVTLLVQW